MNIVIAFQCTGELPKTKNDPGSVIGLFKRKSSTLVLRSLAIQSFSIISLAIVCFSLNFNHYLELRDARYDQIRCRYTCSKGKNIPHSYTIGIPAIWPSHQRETLQF